MIMDLIMILGRDVYESGYILGSLYMRDAY